MKYIVILALTLATLKIQSQDLFSLLDSVSPPVKNIVYETGTFKSVRLINGYSSEMAQKNDLVFSISHRFAAMNLGAYDLWGLDESQIRFGLEYGLTDRIDLGFGRSSYNKLYDGFIKINLFRQSSGAKNFPFTITLLEGMAVKTIHFTDTFNFPFSARLYYTHELLISHKFNSHFSAQCVPVLVHRNMVRDNEEQNLVPAVGLGANVTINKWLSVSSEYFYILPGYTADHQTNSFALGVELESGGGHVFQIHISNSRGMTETSFIPETTGKWLDGDIQLGFNIIRVFHTKKKSKK